MGSVIGFAAAPLAVPVWSAAPFVLLLLAIAILPMVAEPCWHNNRKKGIVVALFAAPVVILLLSMPGGLEPLIHAIEEYISFFVLLGSLFVISGGVAVTGDLRGRPTTNTLFLAVGAVLANFVGTT